MECRLVLNNHSDHHITNKEMSGHYQQCLKYYKFRRVQSKTGKSIFYLFFRKEEESYFALRAARAMKKISLVRYRPLNPIDYEAPFRPFPPQSIIDPCRYAFRKYLDKFTNEVWKKTDPISILTDVLFNIGPFQNIFASFVRTNYGTKH